jgi:hypothetical protein
MSDTSTSPQGNRSGAMRIALDKALNGELRPLPAEVAANYQGPKSIPFLGCPLVDGNGATVTGYEATYAAGDGPSLRSSWHSLTVNELRHPAKARSEQDRALRNRRRMLADQLHGVPFATDLDGTAWFVASESVLR